MRSIRAGLLVALAAAVIQTAPAGAAPGIDPVYQVRSPVTYDYGSAVNNLGEVQTLRLDLYEPEIASPEIRPAIVFAHGGGFTGGSRTDASIVGLATAFAERGYVTASISYRLRPSGTPGSPTVPDLVVGSLAGEMPAAMRDAQHDMQAAVRWMRANASAFAIDPDAIIAAGTSAGASMALETAFNPEDPGESGNPGFASDVAGAVSLSGATDPRRIEAGAPPVMLHHGTNDTTAPYPTALATCGWTKVLGNVCHQVTWVGVGHDLSPYHDHVIRQAAAFLCDHVVDCAPA